MLHLIYATAVGLVPAPACRVIRPAAAARVATVRADGGLADFSGSWEMDLRASDSLGPVLRELKLNSVVAAIVTRLPVRESITQQGDAVTVHVKTRISESVLELLPGTVIAMPGISGGTTNAISTWLDSSRLQTVQALEDSPSVRPDEPSADTFVTVRSLADGGASLFEDVTVRRGGKPVQSARRILRRVAPRSGSPGLSAAHPSEPDLEPGFDLILSSGFLCFSSHAGFLTALEERAMAPDAVVGTSSGALAAACFAAGYSADEIAHLLSAQRPISLARPAAPWRGLASTRALERRMAALLPATFEELKVPLALGVYRKCRGDRLPLLLTTGDLPGAVAASCAVPGIFAAPRVGVGPTRYADGGAVDRTGTAAWRRWRPGKRAYVNLVTDLPPPDLGPRDGFLPEETTRDLRVVRTPRARASFLSLGDFEGERSRATQAAGQQLDAIATRREIRRR